MSYRTLLRMMGVMKVFILNHLLLWKSNETTRNKSETSQKNRNEAETRLSDFTIIAAKRSIQPFRPSGQFPVIATKWPFYNHCSQVANTADTTNTTISAKRPFQSNSRHRAIPPAMRSLSIESSGDDGGDEAVCPQSPSKHTKA